ncbi:TonB-dependent receptor [Nemorincola caseinilytica]|uniref:TonB-dependent receptor n=1 Tax=Nemorincola caseinilytica TaxID=2054315 RepID=A0ABP8NDG1_9BACT
MSRMTIVLLLLAHMCGAQTIKGKLFGEGVQGKEILPGGMVRWLGTDVATFANENGVFELPVSSIKDRRLIASNMGFVTDTIAVGDRTYVSITLRRDAKDLGTVTITDRSGARLSTTSVGQTEIINQRELSKAACCDLAGCFGTQASVQPQTTNIVTNAQELRILGLSGVYNQVLFDGLPMVYGLNYTYGISTYPGTLVNSIMVSKGTTSVLQGYESISGQINMESRQPDKTERLLLNGYMNSFGEKHANANLATAVGRNKKWHTMLSLHTVQPAGKVDGNNDGFLDLPLLTRYMALNKWRYGNEREKGLSLQGMVRVVSERRIGGQTGYAPAENEGSTSIYGQCVHYTQPEAYVKAGYRLSDDHAVSLAASGFAQQQRSWFGTTSYHARQQSGYLNLQHEWLWREKHLLKYGASYRYQELNEQIAFSDTFLHRTYAGRYDTRLRVPGLFAENTFHWKDEKYTLITGLRLDHHQQWGAYLTPRSMLKYVINDHHTLRASAGTGWRQVNLFAEQVNLLASSRDVVFAEALKPEQAMNWGVSHNYRFEAGDMTGAVTGDFYSTRFSNQFFPDYDSDPTRAIIRNFTGVSRSNALQVDASLTFFKQLEVRAAYNYLYVYRIENGGKNMLPFNPRNRAMAAVSYTTRNKHWQADANMHWFDRMRLPDTRNNPVEYRRPLYSVPYASYNVQLTYKWRTLDVYAGCENLLNYRQPDPIISATNPFGPYFDLSSVWGPTRGRELYVGVRYAIK